MLKVEIAEFSGAAWDDHLVRKHIGIIAVDEVLLRELAGCDFHAKLGRSPRKRIMGGRGDVELPEGEAASGITNRRGKQRKLVFAGDKVRVWVLHGHPWVMLLEVTPVQGAHLALPDTIPRSSAKFGLENAQSHGVVNRETSLSRKRGCGGYCFSWNH